MLAVVKKTDIGWLDWRMGGPGNGRCVIKPLQLCCTVHCTCHCAGALQTLHGAELTLVLTTGLQIPAVRARHRPGWQQGRHVPDELQRLQLVLPVAHPLGYYSR